MSPFSSEEIARLRNAFASRADIVPPCPPVEGIFAAASGELDAAAARYVVDHTATCGACAEAWRLAVALTHDDNQRAVAAPPVRHTWFASHRPILAAAAAALVITTIGLVQYLRTADTRVPEYRNVTQSAISPLPETAELSRDACRLRWSPAGTGARYTVRVATESLVPIVRVADVDGPEYIVPAAALSEVPAGGRIVWQVDATLPDGRTISSPTFVTTVK